MLREEGRTQPVFDETVGGPEWFERTISGAGAERLPLEEAVRELRNDAERHPVVYRNARRITTHVSH
jgi:hypothetical protein